MRIAAMLMLVTTLSAAAEAAVLCAKPERDGTLNGSVKVRQVCKRNEVQLAPADVNFCCTSTTSTAVAPLRSARPSVRRRRQDGGGGGGVGTGPAWPTSDCDHRVDASASSRRCSRRVGVRRVGMHLPSHGLRVWHHWVHGRAALAGRGKTRDRVDREADLC